MTKKHLKKKSEEGNVDSGLQIQLEEDGGGSTRQSGVETRPEATDYRPLEPCHSHRL